MLTGTPAPTADQGECAGPSPWGLGHTQVEFSRPETLATSQSRTSEEAQGCRPQSRVGTTSAPQAGPTAIAVRTRSSLKLVIRGNGANGTGSSACVGGTTDRRMGGS